MLELTEQETEMINNRLQPCPFCGIKPHIYMRDTHSFDIECESEDCYLTTGAGWYIEDVDVLVSMWNTRVQPENTWRIAALKRKWRGWLSQKEKGKLE